MRVCCAVVALLALASCNEPPSDEGTVRLRAPNTESNAGGQSHNEPTDAQLEDRISAALLGDPRTAQADLHIDVTAGVVVLSGRASSREQADVAVTLTGRVPGVTRVADYISIGPPPMPPSPASPPSDDQIRAVLQRAFGASSQMQVSVSDGIVTLQGIANAEQVDRAMAIAEAAGARGVVDQTRLVPLEVQP